MYTCACVLYCETEVLCSAAKSSQSDLHHAVSLFAYVTATQLLVDKERRFRHFGYIWTASSLLLAVIFDRHRTA